MVVVRPIDCKHMNVGQLRRKTIKDVGHENKDAMEDLW